MYGLGQKSTELLSKAHPAWTLIIQAALLYIDIQVVESLRDKDTQNRFAAEGKSKLKYPEGRHNRTLDPKFAEKSLELSDALDLVIHPFGYTTPGTKAIVYAAGIIRAEAKRLGFTVRWGGDWNSDGAMNDRRGEFYDPWHFELVW